MAHILEYDVKIISSASLVVYCAKKDARQLVTIAKGDPITSERHCDSIRFQDQQFPCVHAAAAFINEDRNLMEAIGYRYLLTNLTRAYAIIYDHLEPEIGISRPKSATCEGTLAESGSRKVTTQASTNPSSSTVRSATKRGRRIRRRPKQGPNWAGRYGSPRVLHDWHTRPDALMWPSEQLAGKSCEL